MKFRSKNLLVTGGAGFIGSNFIKYLLKLYNHVKIINLDLLTYAGDLDNTKSFHDDDRYTFIRGNICDKELLRRIFKKFSIDGIINFAAESHVDNSIINPSLFTETNILGVHSILQIANEFWMNGPFKVKSKFSHSRFHQISTDEVYGSIEFGSFSESNKYSPSSPYSASKAAADMLISGFHKTYGLDTTISICSNNYGPNQNLEKFIPKILSSIKKSFEIPIYGTGNNIRDWIYVEDHCEAIDLIFNKSKAGLTYNIASKNELTNLDVVEIINSLISNNSKAKVKFIEDRYGHDFRYSVNIDKIKSELAWVPKTNFEEGIKKLLDS